MPGASPSDAGVASAVPEPVPLARRVLAEALGTGLLVAAVVGSGIAAQRLSPADRGLQLLENALVTGATLTVLIVVLQPASAAFNPVVTVLERVTRQLGTKDCVATVVTQLVAGAAGAVLANLMFGRAAVSIASTVRSGAGVWLAEVVATAGLVLTITGLARTGRSRHTGWAVGLWITGAYWFTSSTSFANPAVTLARVLSDSFAGIAPGSVPAFVLCQAVGGILGFVLARGLYPGSRVPPHPSRPGETS